MAESFKSSYKLGPDGPLLEWLDSIEQEGIYWRSNALREGDRYERIYQGVRRAGDSSGTRFRANVVGPTVRRRNALLTENKPIFKIEPLTDGLQTTAEVLNEVSDFAWQDHGFVGAIERMVELASVFRAAGMSLRYDQRLNGGLGSIVPVVRDPRSVLIDPATADAKGVQSEAKYIMIESVECIWDIQRDFPGRGMLVKPDRGVSGTIRSPFNNVSALKEASPSSYRDSLQKLQEGPIPRAIKKDFFIRDPRLRVDGTPVFPRGRHVCRAGDIILSDGPNPFFDGEPDLVWYENRRDFTNIWGHNEVEALRYLQGAVNRIGDMFVNNTVLFGNSRVIADSDALGNDTLNRLTNAEALIITKKRQSSVVWEPPPPMPGHFLQFITFAMRLVDYLIGLNDGQLEGRGRIEMRSGVQLEGLQNAAQVLIRAMARAVEEFIERLGKKFISRVLQFYTGNRILYSIGSSGKTLKYKLEYDNLLSDIRSLAASRNGKFPNYQAALSAEIEDAASKFRFMVQPMSSLATTKVARAQLLMQLVEAVMLPRTLVLQEVGFHNSEELIGQAQQEAATMAAMNIPQGGAKKRSGGAKKAA